MLDTTALIFVIISAIETVLIIVGNSFAIFVFWTQTFPQRRTCLLLINLSAADLLVGVAESLVLATTETIPIRRQFAPICSLCVLCVSAFPGSNLS